MSAGLITFRFNGEVNSVDPELATEFTVGELISGSYTFESSTPDFESTDPSQGHYFNSITDFSMTIGDDYTITHGLYNHIFIGDGSLGIDAYTPLLADPIGASVAGLSLQSSRLELADTSATVFSSDALPNTSPSLAAFDYENSNIKFSNGNGVKSVRFKVTLLEIIPEPTALALTLIATIIFASDGIFK